jgi:hypothetical protein
MMQYPTHGGKTSFLGVDVTTYAAWICCISDDSNTTGLKAFARMTLRADIEGTRSDGHVHVLDSVRYHLPSGASEYVALNPGDKGFNAATHRLYYKRLDADMFVLWLGPEVSAKSTSEV